MKGIMDKIVDISYQRDGRANYLVITEKRRNNLDYQTSMLIHNHIEGLLDLHIVPIDNIIEYHYNISSKQSLALLLEHQLIQNNILKAFIQQIHNILISLTDYLLDSNFLVIKPELIYVNINTLDFYFCYFPNNEQNFLDSLKAMFQFFLNKLDYQDKECVSLAYRFYQQSITEGYCFEDIQKELLKITDQAENKMEKIEEEPVPPVKEKKIERMTEPQIQPEKTEKEKEVVIPWKEDKVLILGIGLLTIEILVNGVVWYMNWKKYLHISEEILAIGIVLGFLTGAALYYYKKNRRQTKIITEETWIYYNEESDNKTDNLKQDKIENSDSTILLASDNTLEAHWLSSLNSIYPDILLDHFPFLIGKLEGQVDAVIPYNGVSRIHLKLEREEENYYIMDLNSKNGVAINGKELMPQGREKLEIGDEIRIADLRYVFQ